MTTFVSQFIDNSLRILNAVETESAEHVAEVLAATKAGGGRLFICGSGGGAGHASHAACDFRKLAGIESYSVTDNVSELTARVNDEGWVTAYTEWLRASRLSASDCLFVFSVGGGDTERGISANLTNAMAYGNQVGASIVGIVGRDGGELKKWADAYICIPPLDPGYVTAHTEGLQAVFWHMLVSHPLLVEKPPKWEAVADVSPPAANDPTEGR